MKAFDFRFSTTERMPLGSECSGEVTRAVFLEPVTCVVTVPIVDAACAGWFQLEGLPEVRTRYHG